jgi:phage N-6-adenine-methyltransferase
MNRSTIQEKWRNSSVEWYTPPEHIEAARRVMGGIDLDPASSSMAQKVVRAKRFFTKDDDGLAKRWSGRVFLNPPFSHPHLSHFVSKLCAAVETGEASQAILLTNSSTDCLWWQRAAALASSICFHRGRISFWAPAGKQGSAMKGQTFFYFGRRRATFRRIFSEFGRIVTPASACQAAKSVK